MREVIPAGKPVTLSSAQEAFGRWVAQANVRNPLIDEPLRLERSPGNVVLVQGDDGAIEVIAFDALGIERERSSRPRIEPVEPRTREPRTK